MQGNMLHDGELLVGQVALDCMGEIHQGQKRWRNGIQGSTSVQIQQSPACKAYMVDNDKSQPSGKQHIEKQILQEGINII